MTVTADGSLLLHEQHGIVEGKTVSAAQLAALWTKGAPADCNVKYEEARSVGLKASDLSVNPSSTDSAVSRAGVRTKAADAERKLKALA